MNTDSHATVLRHETLVDQRLDVKVVPDAITVFIVTGRIALLSQHTGGQAEFLEMRLRVGQVLRVETLGDVENLEM